MTDQLKVDIHIHSYPMAEAGLADKQYEIWEYGSKPDVHFSRCAGTVGEVLGSMAAAGFSRAVLLIYFMGQVRREALVRQLPQTLSDAERRQAVAEIDSELLNRLEEGNRWGCEVSKAHPEISTFVTVDLFFQSGDDAAAHVREMVEEHGARGLKLHGAMQGFSMSDERLWSVYELCQELGLPVLGHGGPDRQGGGFAEPRAFGAMLKSFPRLKVVVAHMGGATWRQAPEIAELYPNAYFDCCEIIEWTGAPNAPTDEELARLMRAVGSDRVMMGSDFPWYDLDHTVQRVSELPILSATEKEAIMGANAMRILGL